MVNSLGTRSAEHGPRPADVAAARAAIPTIDAAVLVPDIKRAILEVVATSHSARTLGTSPALRARCSGAAPRPYPHPHLARRGATHVCVLVRCAGSLPGPTSPHMAALSASPLAAHTHSTGIALQPTWCGTPAPTTAHRNPLSCRSHRVLARCTRSLPARTPKALRQHTQGTSTARPSLRCGYAAVQALAAAYLSPLSCCSHRRLVRCIWQVARQPHRSPHGRRRHSARLHHQHHCGCPRCHCPRCPLERSRPRLYACYM